MAIINDISENDNLSGTEQNDQIYNGAGNDTLISGSGKDSLVGASDSILTAAESGDNSVFYDFQDDIDATTDFSVGKKSLVTSKVNRINGTSKDDYLPGTSKNDQIYGYGGNDILIGGLGNDYLVGGSGNDTLTGNGGRDTFVLYYSAGDIDTLTDYTLGTDSISITSAPNRSTGLKTLGSTDSKIEPLDKYLSYNPANGALYYMHQQLASLPLGLDPSQVIGDIIG